MTWSENGGDTNSPNFQNITVIQAYFGTRYRLVSGQLGTIGVLELRITSEMISMSVSCENGFNFKAVRKGIRLHDFWPIPNIDCDCFASVRIADNVR